MNGLLIALRQDNGKHLYEQIYGYIKEEIRKGRLRFGERLPSTRSLSEFLQVSRSTVELAYGQLLSEGYIEARPYRGYFVCQVEELFDFTDRGAVREAGMLSGEPLRENDAADGRGRPVCGGRQNSVADGTYLCDFSPDSIDMTVCHMEEDNERNFGGCQQRNVFLRFAEGGLCAAGNHSPLPPFLQGGKLSPGTGHYRGRQRLYPYAVGEDFGQACGSCHGESYVPEWKWTALA